MNSFFFPSITSFNHLMRGHYIAEDKESCMGHAISSCSWHAYSNGVVDARDRFFKIEGRRRIRVSYAEALQAYFKRSSPPANTYEALLTAGAESVYWTTRIDACDLLEIQSVARLRGFFVERQTDYPFGACGIPLPASDVSPEAWEKTMIAHAERMQKGREASLDRANDSDTELTNVKDPNLAAARARYAYAVADRASLFRNADGTLQRGGGQNETVADIQRSFQELKRAERPQGLTYEEDDSVYLGRHPTREALDYANLAKLHLADIELEWSGDWKKATEWLAALEAGKLPLKPMQELFHALSQSMTQGIRLSVMRSHLRTATRLFEKLFSLATNEKTPPEARTILASLLEKSKDVLSYALTLYVQHPQQTPKTKMGDPLLLQRKKMLIPRCLPYRNIGTQRIPSC